MRVRETLSAAAARLAQGSDTPRLDAELLMAHALGSTRETLLLSDQEGPAPDAFDVLLERRVAGEPVAYIVGRRDFWTIELLVGPGALVPRPDSETLIEAALDHFGGNAPARILDLGTGPGTLLLAALAEWPQATGIGIDRSPEALSYAGINAERLGLSPRVEFRLGNWAAGLDGRFDLVLCNPPYIEAAASLPRDVADWEPEQALFAGPDGLDDYRRLAPAIPLLLASGGVACMEIGAGQRAAVAALFEAEGVTVESRKDLNDHDRCLIVTA